MAASGAGASGHRRTLNVLATGGPRKAKDGEAVYSHLDEFQQALSGEKAAYSRWRRQVAAPMVALHLDFVARPNGSRELASELAAVLEAAKLADEGLASSLLLISDREARLVTLLTFWDRRRFMAARECRTAWMQKLLAPFADGSIRAHTSLPRFVTAEAGVPAADPMGFDEARVEQMAAG